MLSRQVKLPNRQQVQKWLDTTWFYTKVIFALCIFGTFAYGWGTYNPNKSAVAAVNTELDKFYVNKIKEMDLQEPEFTYNNDIQFVRAMHKCINYINFTTPKHLRVPYEMIIGQAALESLAGVQVDLQPKVIIYLVLEHGKKHHHIYYHKVLRNGLGGV